jgi:4-amino-4-deoxy-L-arabinose transferase-like glycosyltransferase
MTRRVLILSAICTVAALRIALTHGVFSPTWDEPIHVNAGHEYLADGDYTQDNQHPPLARVAAAWPLRHATPSAGGWERPAQIYESAGSYMKGVIASRRGNLLFVILATIGVYLWAAALFGEWAGAAAAVLFTNLPPILAHGGLATTDMAGAATFAVAMAALHHWLDRATWPRTLLLAAAIGLGLVAKFSFPLFFAIGAVVMMVARRRFPWFKGLVAHLLAFVVVWLVYFQDFRRLRDIDPGIEKMATELFGSPWFARSNDLPAPRFFLGLMQVALHDREGHGAYLLGEISDRGWWYFFPVAIGVKTPLPFLALALAGVWLTRRRNAHVAVIAGAMLGSLMLSNINIGVRHALPIYVPLAVLAGAAVVLLWPRARIAVAALAVWMLVATALAHPDYLPWMNAIAGNHPERILVDSNLDWGQDVLRLASECRRLRIAELQVDLFGTTDLRRIGLPPTRAASPHVPTPGWYALSETQVVTAQVHDRQAYRWLTDRHPFRRVGKTIRLYEVK